MIFVVAICLLGFVDIVSADTFGTGANQFTIDFVDISGDANPTSGYGNVNHDYRMGTYEITNGQWNKFQASYGTVTGSPLSAYDESAYFTGTKVLTNKLSWYEGAQFVNYLNTSTGHQAAYKFTGTQGTAAYTFSVWGPGDSGYNSDNPFRNNNSKYFIPTENEWVKAAYWNGTNLQTYATTDGSVPVAGVDTNYGWAAVGQPWNVGRGSEELNGTFDMMGNVFEWMESSYSSGDYLYGSFRGIRGGAYDDYADILGSSNRYSVDPSHVINFLGFRVASVVPEPCSLLLLGLGGLVLRRIKS